MRRFDQSIDESFKGKRIAGDYGRVYQLSISATSHVEVLSPLTTSLKI